MQTAKRCSGDVIALCDQDDVWHPDKLARCVVPFADPEVTLVCHDANVVDASGRRVDKAIVVRRNGEWRPSQTPLHSQYGLTMVIRLDLTAHYDLWLQTIDENTSDRSQHAAHDPWFYFLAINLGKVVNIDEPLVDYFQHESNTIGIPLGFVNRTLQYRSQYYQLRVQAVSIRIAILSELQKRTTTKYHAYIAQQFNIYRRHLKIYEARALIYSDAPLAARCIGLFRSIAAGGYAQQGFGLRALVADMVYGIIRFNPGPRLYAMLQRS
jgi:glycosyltransferase involved in cell wall biosynthesis